ncbi:MAG: biopolymer transporter ExbD [Balneolales bacterium]
MKKNSFLIRFIDIGLILLFGFVIISDITVRSQFVLPGHEDTLSETDETRNILLFVEINEPNEFKITEIGTDVMYDEIDGLTRLEELLLFIRQEKLAENAEITAVLHSREEATMQQLVDVIDICDRIGIPRSINIPS